MSVDAGREVDQSVLLTHRPAGSGHPYADSPDQRVPVRPLVGEPVRLGLGGPASLAEVTCHWRAAGEAEQLLPMRWEGDDGSGLAHAGGEGHLAAAQAGASGSGPGRWVCDSPPVTGPVHYAFTARDGEDGLTTGTYAVAPLVDAAGAGVLRLVRPDRTTPLQDALAEPPTWLADADGVWRTSFALRLRPGDHVVGFGERFDSLDHRGSRLDSRVFEQYKAQGRHGRTYLPMPFAHVLPDDPAEAPWAFHVDTSTRVWFDVGATRPDLLRVTVELDGAPDPVLEVVIHEGGPAAAVQAFTADVGRAEPLPDWVHRLWASGNEWNTQAEVMRQLDQHDRHGIPVGVVVIEAWSDERGFVAFRDARCAVHPDGSPHALADFTFPADGAWPDPAAMVRELHDRGIKVLLWQIPLQKTRHELGEELVDQAVVDGDLMVARGHVVREADGTAYRNRGWWFPRSLMPDLTDPAARDWWLDKRRYLVRDLGVDGFKTDGGEHAWGDDLRYADGRTGASGNNLYPVHYARAYGDLLRYEGRAPVTFSRAGYAGIQAHGVVWAGDEDSTWEAYRSSITAGLSAGACGVVYWGWDLAGFSGPVPEPELYLRAAGAAAFMPVMQYHSEFNHHRRPARDRTPWHVARTHDAPQVVDTFRGFARLRERLVPYLARQARVAIETGRPLMRALFFDHREDPEIWAHPLTYQLGDDLLVDPVTEPGATTWSTYLPHGDWVDVWTGEAVAGGSLHERDVPLDVVPVYCRAAAWGEMRSIVSPG
ncbi:glycoside hydrolase family 31 protein [Serinicoccus kebangsaanensis]|uniref:glycoside hydrolase family 31 protein n=1 Tax=Serinicoccus kebangsaanensis TaxID=2602069 RepID=UPI00192DCC50|nr:TIM-barrel domain-containing protein [Serinicoccus kebangsaanensis]